jgi:hypothetical protein
MRDPIPDPSDPHPMSDSDMSRMVHFDKLPGVVQDLVRDMPVWRTHPAALNKVAVTIFVPDNLATEDEADFCLLSPGMDECFLNALMPTDLDPSRQQWPRLGKGFESVKEASLVLRLDAEFFDTQEEADEYFRHDPITIIDLRNCLLARPEGTRKLLSLFEDQLSVRAAIYDEALLNDIAPQLTAMDVTVVLDAIDLERSSYSLQNLGNGYFFVNDFKIMHLRPEVTKGQLLFRPDRERYKMCVAKSVFPELEAVSPNIGFKSLVAGYLPESTILQW